MHTRDEAQPAAVGKTVVVSTTEKHAHDVADGAPRGLQERAKHGQGRRSRVLADLPDRDTQNLGALGLAAGLALHPLGVAAAIGLVLFFVCAVYTHVRADDYGPQFGLAIGFLALNVAVLIRGVGTA